MKKKLENVRVESMAATGKALAKVEGKVIFIDKAVPGDLVDIRLIRKKKSFSEAIVEKFHEYSPDRLDAKCDYFGLCGGCKWQNIHYKAQLEFKQQQVVDNLSRIGKVELPEILPIIPSPEIFEYRNKLEFTFSNKRWLTREEIDSNTKIERNGVGFHMPGHFDKVIDIKTCHLQENYSNIIKNEIRDYALANGLTFYDVREHTGLLRNLVVRTSKTGELMIILQVGQPDKKAIEALLDHLVKRLERLSSVYYVINQKKNDDYSDQEMIHFAGEKWIMEEMTSPTGIGKLQYQISPKSFYQTNSTQAETLYRLVWEFADLTGNEVAYDLYTGTGTIACYLAAKSKKVVGVEYVEDAVKDARINARINRFRNMSFFSGDMKDVFTQKFIEDNGKPDIVITDPPRAGMHKDVCTQLLNLNSRKIIYISCNPATQARDVELLSERYQVTVVQPVDMFPHTPHVENIVVLEKNH